MKKYIAEFIGTFGIVFCGTGAIIYNETSGGEIGNMGIAIAFGAIVTTVIYTLRKNSGAHFNPAVTITFFLLHKFRGREIVPYLLSQIAGALTASLTLRVLYPWNEMLGTTQPHGTEMESFVLETLLTFFLILIILIMAKGSEKKAWLGGLVIGFVIFLEALFAGPVTGASMNPARSLGPAIISGHLEHLWIYLAAPLLGGIFAVLIWKIVGRIPKRSRNSA